MRMAAFTKNARRREMLESHVPNFIAVRLPGSSSSDAQDDYD